MGKYGRTYHFENGLSLAVEAKDGPWVVRWTEKAATVGGRPQSKRRSTGTTDLAQAREYLTGFASRRLHENVKAQVITCGDILELYETYLRTHHKHRSNLDVTRKLMRFWRDVPVSEVNVFTQRQYEAERRRGLHSNYRVPRSAPGPISDATLCRDIVGLNAALSWAVKSGVIDNHQPLIPLPNSVPRPPTLTAAEADELMALAAETSVGKPRLTRIHRWVWMAVITGVRCKALEKLQWSQVDWTQGDGWIDFNPPGRRKTKSKLRPVQPISPRLLPLMRQAYAERINNYVLDGPSIEWLWRQFRAGTPFANVDLHRHDLRAVAITTALDKGMPTAKASKYFGVSIKVIEDKYLRAHATEFLDDVGAYI